MPTRLDTIDPDLAAAIASAPPASQRAIAGTAALLAITHTDHDDDLIAESITALRTNPNDPDIRERLTELTERLDEAAFDLHDQADEHQTPEATAAHETAFAKARAAAALTYAFDPDPHQAAIEGTYEANAATDNIDALTTMINLVLRASHPVER